MAMCCRVPGERPWVLVVTGAGRQVSLLLEIATQFTGRPKPAEFPVQLSGIIHNSDDMPLLLQKVLMLCWPRGAVARQAKESLLLCLLS